MYELILLAICVWREARGESLACQEAVAWSIRNRAMQPSWWGDGYVQVILQPYQYSSFNSSDVNATKFPQSTDPSWSSCLGAAGAAYNATIPDPTGGATNYYDISIPAPSWAAEMTFTMQSGTLRFYR